GLDLTTPRRVESVALEVRGRALAGLGDIEGGLADVATSRGVSVELGITGRIVESWIEESGILALAGRLDEAVTAGLRAVEYAATHGMAGHQGAVAMAIVTDALIDLGRWTEAAERMDQIWRVADDAVL